MMAFRDKGYNFFMLFSDPYMAGLALQYSLHAMVLSEVFPVPTFYQFLVYAVIPSPAFGIIYEGAIGQPR
jgi:hypothetical protein